MSLPVIFLMGPTGSGKTALVCALARRYPLEVVSVDAAQVYRGLDIGTAKVSLDERRRCPHHLIDIVEPDEAYSAARFCADAVRLVREIHDRGRLPVLAGGTMFYFHALAHGLPELPSSDAALRAVIAARAMSEGWPALHAELAASDPRRAAEIAPADGQRIQRALEINALSGSNVRPRRAVNRPVPWPLIRLALAPGDRRSLHRRLEMRFRGMLDAGLVDEVAALLENCAGATEPPSLKLVGYRQVAAYLRGQLGYTRMMEASVADTRRLAKRQLTWLRGQSGVVWMDSEHPALIDGLDRYLEANSLISATGRSAGS